METPFKAISFEKNETITTDMLEGIQSNNQWLKDNTPRTRLFLSNGRTTDVRSVIIGGRIHIKRNKRSAEIYQRVNLGRAFHPNCSPLVTTGVVSEATKQVFCVVNGLHGRMLPSASAFEIKVYAENAGKVLKKKKDWKIAKGFFVYWQAMGYRKDDMDDF